MGCGASFFDRIVVAAETHINETIHRIQSHQTKRYRIMNSNSEPYISSNGEICIPINTYSGLLSQTLPRWIQNNISYDNYQAFINQINTKTQPAIQNLLQLAVCERQQCFG